ncbi:MAG: ribose 5-phosphate isomerase B [bacterium]|nr:ribose 5-phosphate isomerase B [bacterium]
MSKSTDQQSGVLRVVVGTDHRGTHAGEHVLRTLERLGHEGYIVNACEGSCDYPEQAYLVGEEINSGNAQRGVLICGTGIGMSIAANKIKNLRAALVHDELTAQLSRSHNDANVLCLSADLLGERLIEKIIEAWMSADFEGGRHARRVKKICSIEEGLDPRQVTDAQTA